MCLNLNDYQFKTSRHNYRSTYMNTMVTTNQKPTTDTLILERKEQKHTTKGNHQSTKVGKKEEINTEELQKQLENK